MDEIRVLQIGDRDWRQIYAMTPQTAFEYAESFEAAPKKPFDMVFWDRAPGEREIDSLYQATKAYTLFVTEQVELEGESAWLYESRKGRRIAPEDIQGFLLREVRNYFPKPYGEKFRFPNLAIA